MGNTRSEQSAAGERQSLLQMVFGKDLGSHTESRDPMGAGRCDAYEEGYP